MHKLFDLLEKPIIRYFIMACIIVGLELVCFQAVFLASGNYEVATVLSFIFAVVLNWIGSRKLVFGASHFSAAKEFTLVLIASIVGLALQMSIVFLSVEVLKLYPLVGKVLSIFFSFFWNYWFRARFIYSKAKRKLSKTEEEESIDAAVY